MTKKDNWVVIPIIIAGLYVLTRRGIPPSQPATTQTTLPPKEAPILTKDKNGIAGTPFIIAMGEQTPLEIFTEPYEETYDEWSTIPYVPPVIIGEPFAAAMEQTEKTPIQIYAENEAPNMTSETGIAGSRFLAAIQ